APEEEAAPDAEAGGVAGGEAEHHERAEDGGHPLPALGDEEQRAGEDQEAADEPADALVEEGLPEPAPGGRLLQDLLLGGGRERGVEGGRERRFGDRHRAGRLVLRSIGFALRALLALRRNL